MKRSLSVLILLAGLLGAWNANYTVSLDQKRLSNTLNNSLSFSRNLTRHLSLNGSTAFAGYRNWGQGRFEDSRDIRGWLSWRPRSGMEFSSGFTRGVSLKYLDNINWDDRVQNTASGSIRYAPSDWLNMNIQAGIHSLDYRRVVSDDSLDVGESDGSLYDMSATVNRKLFSVIRTSLSVSESRSFGDLADTGRDNISTRIGYYFPDSWKGGSFNAEISANRNRNTSYITESVRRGNTWRHSESLVFPELISGIFMEMSGSWSYSSTTVTDFFPDTTIEGNPDDQAVNSRNIGCTMVWEMMRDLDLNISIARTLKLHESKRQIYGVPYLFDLSRNEDDRMMTFRLVYTPGSSTITFIRLVNLFRRDTYGTWEDSFGNIYEDETDLDELREALGLTARIPVKPGFLIKGEMQGQRRETIYINASMSGENSRSSTYSVRPGYEYSVGSGWKVDHVVALSADYTTYFFPQFTQNTNRLSRRLESFFTFNRVSQDSTVLGVSHVFRFRDQGRYENRLFSRTEESVTSQITLNMGFHVSKNVGITPSYGWEYFCRNRLDQGVTAAQHTHHLGIRSSIRVLGGILSTNITRSFLQSSAPSYWQAAVNFNYLL